MTEQIVNRSEGNDDAIRSWRQGDVILDVNLLNSILTTTLSLEDSVGKPIVGLVVVSQTCDVIKENQKIVTVAAVVNCADSGFVTQVKNRKASPRYAYIPSLEKDGLVADISILTALSKERLLKLQRTDGGFDYQDSGDNQFSWIARFQDALARLSSRFAFPDNFNPFKRALGEQLRLLRKDASSKKGIQAIDEIVAEIEVTAGNVSTAMIWFILESSTLSDNEMKSLNANVALAMKNVRAKNNTFNFSHRIVEPSEVTLEQYKRFHRIDFDDVS
ncbi:MAG: hypothetical protein AB7E52_04575 [Bdellovibrionales bacterium]